MDQTDQLGDHTAKSTNKRVALPNDWWLRSSWGSARSAHCAAVTTTTSTLKGTFTRCQGSITYFQQVGRRCLPRVFQMWEPYPRRPAPPVSRTRGGAANLSAALGTHVLLAATRSSVLESLSTTGRARPPLPPAAPWRPASIPGGSGPGCGAAGCLLRESHARHPYRAHKQDPLRVGNTTCPGDTFSNLPYGCHSPSGTASSLLRRSGSAGRIVCILVLYKCSRHHHSAAP